MTEALGAAGSIVGIVSFGLALATTLQTYVEAVQGAEDRICELVFDVNSTASALKQLQEILDTDLQNHEDVSSQKSPSIFTTMGREEIMVMAVQCGDLYTTIVKLLNKADTTGAKRKGTGKVTAASVDVQMLRLATGRRNLKWPWLEPRIKRCQEQLRWLKMSLLFNLQLARLARFQLKTTDRGPGSFEEELSLRYFAENLWRQRLKVTSFLAEKRKRKEAESSKASNDNASRTSFYIHSDEILPPPTVAADNQQGDIDADRVPHVSEDVTIKDFTKVVLTEFISPPDDPSILLSNQPKAEATVESQNPETFEGISTEAINSAHPGPFFTKNDESGSDTLQNSGTEFNTDVDISVLSVKFDQGGMSESSTSNARNYSSKEPVVKTSASNTDTGDKLPEERTLPYFRPAVADLDRHSGLLRKKDSLEILTRTVFKRRFPEMLQRLFGSRDKAMQDRESKSLEAFILLGDSRVFKVPFGHQCLTSGLKAIKRKTTPLFWAPYFALHPHQHEILTQILKKLKDEDGRERTCLGFESLDPQSGQDSILLVFFSLGPFLEPIQVDDCVGRKLIIPFHLGATLKGIQDLLKEAFLYVQSDGQRVAEGFYDLFTPDKKLIVPATWESLVKPGWSVTMKLWPLSDDQGIPPVDTHSDILGSSVPAEYRRAVPPMPSEPRKVLRFKDAVSRPYSFPFDIVQTWSGMEKLIRQAFSNIESLAPSVADGRYDLISPNGDIILPQLWDKLIEPGWLVTMFMWPKPEPPKPPGALGPPGLYPGPSGGQSSAHAKPSTVRSDTFGGGQTSGIPPPPPPGHRGVSPVIIIMEPEVPPTPAALRAYGGSRSYRTVKGDHFNSESAWDSDSSTGSALVPDSDIEDEDTDLGIEIDYLKEKVKEELSLGDLLGKLTNAIDTSAEPFEESDDSDSETSSTELADD